MREILASAMENMPKDTNWLYLAYGTNSAGSLGDGTENLFYRNAIKQISSAESYIITDKGAKILLENSQIINNKTAPVDWYVPYMIEIGKLKAAAVWPRIVVTNLADTTMNLDR